MVWNGNQGISGVPNFSAGSGAARFEIRETVRAVKY